MTDAISDPYDLAKHVRTIVDFPKPGILFRDVSTLLLDGPAFRKSIDALIEQVNPDKIDLIAGIEARGFVVAAAMSYALSKGKLLLRKKGKLPGEVAGIDYALEYGVDRIEMHADAVKPGQRVLLVDDLLATGGTALAATKLLRDAGAVVDKALFLIDLPALGGGDKLCETGITPYSLIAFPGD